MGRLVLGMFLTIDGFTQSESGEMIGPAWSSDMQTYWSEANAREGQMLLYGRTAFEFNAIFWPAMADDEKAPEGFRSFATVMNQLPKVVISRTLASAEWNATVKSAPLEETIATLKQEFDGDIVAVGGVQLATGLLASEQLDELRLLVVPKIAGRGRSIFDGTAVARTFSLHSNQTLDTGAIVLTYRS
ncbi:MAG TPA: dihydrofolate reductase family protein [Acidimicrobiales bacterium]